MLSFPNFLSILRLILIPFFIYAFVIQRMHWFVTLFLIAGLSDFLDGFLARRLKITSSLGHFLDTLADVPFYAAAFVILFLTYPILLSGYYVWISIFIFTSFMPFFLSLFTYKKIYFEHTKLFKFFSTVLFVVVLSSLYLNVSFMIPILIIGFTIANLHLCLIILKKRSL